MNPIKPFVVVLIISAQSVYGMMPNGSDLSFGVGNPGDSVLPEVITDLIKNMVAVDGGTFTMGCSKKADKDCDALEDFEHKVTVSSFAMSKYEITIAQYAAFVADSKHVTQAEKQKWSVGNLKNGNDANIRGANWKCDPFGKPRATANWNFPVMHVAWADAEAFCKWLSMKTGQNYRLATEAEWEFAAKGGVKSQGFKYSGSNNLAEVAQFFRNTDRDVKEVGLLAPNELGLYDMTGNVQEWCQDWLLSGRNYYKEKNAVDKDPVGHFPTNGLETLNGAKACRGGSYCSTDSRLPVFARWRYANLYCGDGIGFRIVRTN